MSADGESGLCIIIATCAAGQRIAAWTPRSMRDGGRPWRWANGKASSATTTMLTGSPSQQNMQTSFDRCDAIAPRGAATRAQPMEGGSKPGRCLLRYLDSTRRVSTGRNRDDERRRFCRFLAATATHRYAWHLTCSWRVSISPPQAESENTAPTSTHSRLEGIKGRGAGHQGCREVSSSVQAASARCFFDAGRSASFARRLRRSASTAASSGFRLCTSSRNSLSTFDLSSSTRLPSI
jgi:hypothetical protein